MSTEGEEEDPGDTDGDRGDPGDRDQHPDDPHHLYQLKSCRRLVLAYHDYYAGGRGFCGNERCLASSGSSGHQQGTGGLPAQGLIAIMVIFMIMTKIAMMIIPMLVDGDVVQDKKVLVADPDVLSFSVVDHKMQFAGACHRRHRHHSHRHRHHHSGSPSSSQI